MTGKTIKTKRITVCWIPVLLVCAWGMAAILGYQLNHHLNDHDKTDDILGYRDGKLMIVSRNTPFTSMSVAHQEVLLYGTIPINYAMTDTLTIVPGIGPALAAAIVAERETGGPFDTPGDLLRVPGIGEKRVELFRRYFSFSRRGDDE